MKRFLAIAAFAVLGAAPSFAQNPVAAGAATGAAAGGAVAGPPGAAVGTVTGAAVGAAAGLAGTVVSAPFIAVGALASGPGYVDAWTFRRMAASTNLFEIQSSQLALQRSRNPAVRAFATRMIADHSRATAALAQFGAPWEYGGGGLDPRHAAMLNQLSAAGGRGFDRLYARMQIMAHQESVSLFSTYAQTGEWWELRQFAARTVPAMQMHLGMAARVARRV